MPPTPQAEKTIAQNRRAFHEFHVEDRYEAGIALLGSEVKSLRAGHASIGEAWADVKDGQVVLRGCAIEPYAQAGSMNHERTRPRALLLKRAEIAKIERRVAERGYTLVPLRLYFKGSKVKVELGLARGKDVGDKRQTIADREAKRELERAVKERYR